MNTIPKISEAEWEVMKIIWNNNTCTANEVIKLLGKDIQWKPKTVKSLISRLVKKGALSFDVKGRTYYYYPLVKQKDCVKKESRSFLKRVYNGTVKNMFLNFIEDNDLTEEDVDELKKILEDRK